MYIDIKSDRQIEKIRQACKIVALGIDKIRDIAKAGVTTLELDRCIAEFILKKGARSAFKERKGFPSNICTSINEEVVHGIPTNNRTLRDGDILSVDVGVELDGYFGDAAITIGIGNISKLAKKLIKVTKEALEIGIEKAEANNRLYDISFAIQNTVESEGFSVVRQFVGHGIGLKLHEPPQIPNFGKASRGPILRSGMVLALEPMVTAGNWEVKILKNKWTAVTTDKSLSCHFEHTVCIGKNGPEVLTIL